MTLSVLSWNIWMGKYLSSIIDLLKKERPDIIALQEVIQNPDGTQNTAEIIAHALGYQWKFAPVLSIAHEGKTVNWGEAILSRYDIETSAIHDLSKNPRHIGLDATLMIDGKPIHVISTHLTHTHQATSVHQESEAAALVRLAPKECTIIMGDFNALPESKTIKIMRASFVDADPKNQPTWCVYPDGCATCRLDQVKHRLDYIFTTADVTAAGYRAILSDGSDHLPITTRVTLQG